MRNAFPEYFQPSSEEKEALWSQAIFVPDANVLLHAYRFTHETSSLLLSLFEQLGERLYCPHRVALEFLRNRPKVIGDRSKKYDEAHKSLVALADAFCASGGEARVTKSRNGQFDKNPFLPDKIRDHVIAVDEEIRRLREQSNQLLTAHDEVLERISNLFQGKIGVSLPQEELLKREEEARRRIKCKIPPGYCDGEKSGADQCGDYLIWEDMLSTASSLKKPMIFITDDAKEDWWVISNGRTVAPRPELLAEIRSKTNQCFWIYSCERFMERASALFGVKMPKDAIDEAKTLARSGKASRRTSRPKRSQALQAIAEWKASEDAVNSITRALKDVPAFNSKDHAALMDAIRGVGTTGWPASVFSSSWERMLGPWGALGTTEVDDVVEEIPADATQVEIDKKK